MVLTLMHFLNENIKSDEQLNGFQNVADYSRTEDRSGRHARSRGQLKNTISDGMATIEDV